MTQQASQQQQQPTADDCALAAKSQIFVKNNHVSPRVYADGKRTTN
jgi:hypothetical protein